MSELPVETRPGAVLFWAHVQPRASSDEVTGRHGDALKVRVQAAPADGSANARVIAVLAAALGVGRADVRITTGATSRRKRIEVTTARPTELHVRLRALAANPAARRQPS